MTGHWEQPPPPRKRPEDIADYQAWAAFTRALLGWTDLLGDQDDPVVVTEFRHWAGLPSRTESQLRKRALEQLAESRAGTR